MFPNYTPPASPAENTLYHKHVVTVIPFVGITQDAVGAQQDNYGATFLVECNVQPVGDEPTVPADLGPRNARLFTKDLRLKARDKVVYGGQEWLVKAVELFNDNVTYEPHHIEAQIWVTGSRVRR